MSVSPVLGFYRAASTVLGAFAGPYLNGRAKRGKEDPARLGERFGRYTQSRAAGAVVWIHAASVGESGVALALIEALAVHNTSLSFVLTTGPRTSADIVARRAPVRTTHVYAPLDRADCVRRFLDHWRPDVGVFVERQLWPNLILEAEASGVKLALLNARMSPRTLRRWTRWRAAGRRLIGAFRYVSAADARTKDALAELRPAPLGAPGNHHRAGRMTIWDTTQAPVVISNGMAAMLGVSEKQVGGIGPFIGGGFGPKIMMFYQEEVLVPWAAMRLNRPIKWIEDRAENFVATTQERMQIHDAEIAFDSEGHILGVQDSFLHDTGAYDPYGLTIPINSQCTLLGPYHIPHYHSRFRAVFTNKPIVTPYRGAGRQHGVFIIERFLDLAARELGLDKAEIRRRNFIQPDQFPYNNEIIYQDFTALSYDSGQYHLALDKALELIEYDQFIREEQPRLRAEGKTVGIGIVTYVRGDGNWRLRRGACATAPLPRVRRLRDRATHADTPVAGPHGRGVPASGLLVWPARKLRCGRL